MSLNLCTVRVSLMGPGVKPSFAQLNCMSLWIKASAKIINLMEQMNKCTFGYYLILNRFWITKFLRLILHSEGIIEHD